MKTITASLLGFLILFGAHLQAHAFQISPCYRVLTYRGDAPAQETVRTIGRMCKFVLTAQERLAVHEHMVAAAIREYREGSSPAPLTSGWKWQYMVEKPWPTDKPVHTSFYIVFGTWWNDDPLMRTLGQGRDFIRGGIDVWAALRPGDAPYPGGRSGCTVNGDTHLGRQSHLGSLQHLHFMTTLPPDASYPAAQRIGVTTENALVWMAFAYRVATGEIAPDQMLTTDMEKELSLPSIADNHCVSPKNVKIRTLFARQGQSIPERNKRTPDIALGSMLHILQDSFSPAHTCRIAYSSDGKIMAVLSDVKNYAFQISNKQQHAELDVHPKWFLDYLKTGKHEYENDPVTVGAWLISAVDRRLPWPEVEAHLRATIFAPVPQEASTTTTCI